METLDDYKGSKMTVHDLYAVVRKAWYSGEDLPPLLSCLSLHNNIVPAIEAVQHLLEGYKNIFHAAVTQLDENAYIVQYTTSHGDPIIFKLNIIRCDAHIENMKTV